MHIHRFGDTKNIQSKCCLSKIFQHTTVPIVDRAVALLLLTVGFCMVIVSPTFSFGPGRATTREPDGMLMTPETRLLTQLVNTFANSLTP